ncbi:PREDICTED: basic salivary proline-rich protein 1-like [Branchiostoma belcheri]|uniref:Basic salivary proline-rich protein 1-like n=1 Tax=Branchiostoma belcheri TaxID=7741 RepID=A0A6P5A6P3_BRABE|nr:PREDICTED: basic salivary proline-rich protein 1-like [Branchiostoma belcheri]
MIDEVITPTHVGYTGGRGGRPSGNSAGRGSNRRPQPIDEDMIAPSTARPTGGRGGPPGRTADPVPAGRGSNRRPQPIDEDMIAPSTVRPTGGRGGPPGRMADAVMEKADEVFAPSRSSGRRIQPPPKPMVDEVIEPTNVNSPRRRGKPPPTMVDEEIVPSHVNPTGGGRGKPKQQQPVNEEIVPTRVNPSNRREKAPQMVDEVVIPTNVVPSGRRGRPPPQTVNDHEYSNNVGPSGRHGKPPQTTDEEPTAGRPGRQKPNEDKRRKPAEVNGSSNHPRMPNGNGTTTTTSETRRVIQQAQPSVQTYTKTNATRDVPDCHHDRERRERKRVHGGRGDTSRHT